jgi:hypothetical protein
VAVLADRPVPLISFVGNEVNLPGASISGKRRVLSKIRPQWIATQLLQEAGQFLFGDLASLGIVSLPHALNVQVFRPMSRYNKRPIDIGTRVARYVPHLGDNDRNRIADRFIEVGRRRNFTIDISNRRLDRAGWARFLNDCAGTISSEAGSWFLERNDTTVNAIRKYLRERATGVEIASDSVLSRMGYRLPNWLRQVAKRAFLYAGVRFEQQAYAQPNAYDDIHRRFFRAGRAPRSTANASVLDILMPWVPKPAKSCFAADSMISYVPTFITWRSIPILAISTRCCDALATSVSGPP